MIQYSWKSLALLLTLLMVTRCAPPQALTQSIPVSSTPLGAAVYVDGELTGHTPMDLNLTRNRDHLVTLVQPGYRQANMLVQRQYLANDVMMRSMQAGMNTGSFFNNPIMGANAAFNAVQQDKDSGAAYQLIPPALVVTMLPTGAPNPPVPYAGPPYGGAPIYPYPPPPPVQDQSGMGASAGAALGAFAGSSGLPNYNHEHDRSKTTSTTTSHSFVRPDGATETTSSTTSNSSGSTFGFGYNGGSGSGSLPSSGSSPEPEFPAPSAPAVPSMPQMGFQPGVPAGTPNGFNPPNMP
jgi:hypothetical protein